MTLQTEIIIYIIKTIVLNIYVSYSYKKILNIKSYNIKQMALFFVANILTTILSTYVEFYVNSFLSGMILCLVYGIALGLLTNKKIGHALITTIVSYVICIGCLVISAMITYVLEGVVNNYYVILIVMSIIQFALLYGFFKIKRFKNGFSFLRNKLNNEITDIIVINISAIVLIIYCLFGTYYDQMKWSLIIAFLILCIIMFFTIRKMLTMYYKQKLLADTMEQYKEELMDKQNEIDKLRSEKQNVSKITHEFYNRQKALELLVGSNMNPNNIDKDNVSANVLKIIESLTNEYSNRFEEIKELPKLEKCDIPEIDNMFKYMQNECNKNNIEFKLKIIGNMHQLVNNIISKNKLETLIGDHLRDAINAVNLSKGENKEILAILGIKNKKYEFSIFDTGADFKVETLVKLGLQPVTTNESRGGTGTGFMTTFETMEETKASLIITEYPISKDRYYTKCITIMFDGKKQYRIYSHRADEIKSASVDNRIKIQKYTKQ